MTLGRWLELSFASSSEWVKRQPALVGAMSLLAMILIGGCSSHNHPLEARENLDAAVAVLEPVVDDLAIDIEWSVTQVEVEDRFFSQATILERARLSREGFMEGTPSTVAREIDVAMASNGMEFLGCDPRQSGRRAQFISLDEHVITVTILDRAGTDGVNVLLSVAVPPVGQEPDRDRSPRNSDVIDECWLD